MIDMVKLTQETDAPWKYILSKYFQAFIELCCQERAKEINWSKKAKFLDKELVKIAREAATSNRVVDKLIEVELLAGKSCCILIHLELQASKQKEFSERMLVYRYRLRDFYSQPIASMAILLDDDPNWRPNSYSESLWDSEISIRFPIIKLIDYDEKIYELEESSNPFAIIILAQLAALKKQEVELKLANKIGITRKLYGSGLNRKEIIELFRFIDWVISLPKEIEVKYMKNLAELEKEEFEKNFICPAEQIWLEQGIEQGIEQIARKMLNKGIMSITEIAEITNLPIDELMRLKNQEH